MSQFEVYKFLQKHKTQFLSCKDISKLSKIALSNVQRAVGRLYQQGYLHRKVFTYNSYIYATKE